MTQTSTSGPRHGERGNVLLWALLVILIIGGTLTVGALGEKAMTDLAKIEHEAPQQAHAVAHAGIVDAYAWFRRQMVQPVANFAPQLNLALDPPINETDDAAIGLVREYEIAPNFWARYEVRATSSAEPFTDANQNGLFDDGEGFTDLDGDGEWDAARETRDISGERGQAGAGAIWMLVSHGMIYRRPRADLPLGTAPNDRISIARVATEIRRLALTPPAEAAICVQKGSNCIIGSRTRVLGGSGGGVIYTELSGFPSLLAGSEVSGSPQSTGVPNYDGSIPGVFGVSLTELRSMADLSTTDPTTVPARLGDYSLVVVDSDITFDALRPLRGTACVVVLGNCTLEAGSNSFFSGMLWVQGDLKIRAPAYLRGTVIVEGHVDFRGLGGDHVEVNYDDAIITELLAVMGQYRHTKAIHPHDQDHVPSRMRADG